MSIYGLVNGRDTLSQRGEVEKPDISREICDRGRDTFNDSDFLQLMWRRRKRMGSPWSLGEARATVRDLLEISKRMLSSGGSVQMRFRARICLGTWHHDSSEFGGLEIKIRKEGGE